MGKQEVGGRKSEVGSRKAEGIEQRADSPTFYPMPYALCPSTTRPFDHSTNYYPLGNNNIRRKPIHEVSYGKT